MERAILSPPTPMSTSPPPSSSSTSFLVLALSILGILSISLILFIYYLFVTKCFRISWQLSGTGTVSRRHGRYNEYLYPVLYSTAVGGRGLNQSTIQSIPTICYTKDSRHRKLSFHECAVCINEFEQGEKIRLLPDCFHVFHPDCIDTWLQANANCPLCRSPITARPPSMALAIENNIDVVIHRRGFQARGSSRGDEHIDTRREEEGLGVVPMRRSFSMDSSNDKRLCMALQKILQGSAVAGSETGIDESSSSGGAGTGKLRRPFFSFNQNRCSRSAVLPI